MRTHIYPPRSGSPSRFSELEVHEYLQAVSTAVQITHLPIGNATTQRPPVVSCRNSRRGTANFIALIAPRKFRMLSSRLGRRDYLEGLRLR